MKKVISLILAATLMMALGACSNSTANSTSTPSSSQTTTEAAEPVEIIVFAAASMTETLTKVIEQYKSVAPNVTVTPSYESSGTLKTQIEQGADCDLFISAGQKQMNQLDKSADVEVNTGGLDFVLEADR